MNYRKRVLLFNLIFLLVLITVTLVYPYIPALHSSSLRPVNIIAEVEKDTTAISDTTGSTGPSKPEIVNGNVVIKDHNTDSGLVNASGDRIALNSFFSGLAALKKDKHKKIRIGYFGDSFIEGDLITQDLRQLLQQAYGGSGVGFMPVTSISAGFRQTIVHSFSTNWNDVSFKSDNRSSENLYLSGHTFYPADGSWVSYRGVNQPGLDSFSSVQVLFGKPKNDDQFNININGNQQTLNATGLFNSTNIPLPKTREVKIGDNSTGAPLFGFAFESDGGVILDNFSFRGISGVELDNLHPDFLSRIASERPYDLLIIHYGPNLLFKPDLVDFSWYRKKMEPTIKKIKTAFPNTSILLVSTADKGARYGGEWQTEKGVLPLLQTQYEMARADGIDFFNLYNAMGGKNSMINWVDQSLANKDYTHVNWKGGKKIADILFNAITNEFKNYQKHNN